MESLRYQPSSESTWQVFVYGNVPGHQLDWIWRPAGGERGATPLHVQHLHYLVQLFDVPDPSVSTLTIGNLSLGDTRHMPGRGALAVLCHFRLPGARDHSGRPNPPLVVAIVAVDRALDQASVEAAARALRRLTEGDRPAGERPIDAWYERYLEAASEAEAAAVWQLFTNGFDTLPALAGGRGGRVWLVPEGHQLPDQIELVADVEPDAALSAMAGLGEVLYRSRARWAAITDARPTHEQRGQGALIRVSPDGAVGAPRLSALPAEAGSLAASVLPVVDEDFEITTLAPEESAPPPPQVPAPVPAPRPRDPTDTLTPEESDEVEVAPASPARTPAPPSLPPPPPSLPPPVEVDPDPPGFWGRWWALFAISGLCALIVVFLAWRLGDEPDEPQDQGDPPHQTGPDPQPSTTPPADPPPGDPPPSGPPSEPPTEPATTGSSGGASAPASTGASSGGRPVGSSGGSSGGRTSGSGGAGGEPPVEATSPLATIAEAAAESCHLERSGGGATLAITAGMSVRHGTYDLYCDLGQGPAKMVSTTLVAGARYRVKCRGGQCRLNPM